jgi:selenocysteine lyase/cysteine desulfurase
VAGIAELSPEVGVQRPAGVPISAADLQRWRADTPATAHLAHLNNAGASLMPAPVAAVVHEHLGREAEIGGYEAADAAAGAIATSYEALAALVGAAPRNIAVTASATAAYAQALSSFDFARGDVIVTTRADYLSNQLMFLALARRAGVRVETAHDAAEGGVDPAHVRALLRAQRVRLVAVTWVPTNAGMAQPVADVGAVCAEAGVPYLVDACQAVGQLPVDATAIRCDFLAATARKFLRGPRGIGFLYVSDAALARGSHPLLVDMRGANWVADDVYEPYDGARRFEQWELPYALLLGMGAAARYALDAGIARTAARAHALAARVRERLGAIPGVRVIDRGRVLTAIVALECAGRDGRDVTLALRSRGVNTSSQSRDESRVPLDRLGAHSILRVSPHYFNTDAELDRLEAALCEVLGVAPAGGLA